MAGQRYEDLKAKSDAAWQKLTAAVQGMEPHLERADAPGEWTTREVLSHLLFPAGWDAAETLRAFAERDLPLIEIVPGRNHLDDERKRMSLRQLVDGLDAQRQAALRVVQGLSDAELGQRKARVPLFKQIGGSEEVPLAVFVAAIWGAHWANHVEQLGKIRKAVGLPDAA